MKDPYQILNITPDATDEQVREAYRSLARKYQPENYENSPLADMAAKKMDEINGAYDAIITMRRSQSSSAQSGYSAGYTAADMAVHPPWEISAPKSTPTASMMRKPCSTASHRRHAVQSGIF